VDRAIARIRKCRELGYLYIVDGDIHTFFDRVDHDLLLQRLGERQPGETVMDLVRQWVRGCIWDGSHIRRLVRGVPQGSPISPLLANFFLEDFDRELEKSGRKLIRYADDFVILAKTQEEAGKSLAESQKLLAEAHLELNLEKTRIVDFAHGFRFLGALFQVKGFGCRGRTIG
jgi:retron-type reverse transcriptase